MGGDFQLLFSQGRGVVSRLVRWFCRSRYLSHTVGNFTVFRADVILEASEDGVQFAPAKHFRANNTVEAVVRPRAGALATREGMDVHLTWLIETYGACSYDWLAAGSVGILNRVRWLWRILGKWLRTKWGADAVHCTELWVNLLKHAHYRAVDNMDAELSDPLRLLRLLTRDPEFEVLLIGPGVKEELASMEEK